MDTAKGSQSVASLVKSERQTVADAALRYWSFDIDTPTCPVTADAQTFIFSGFRDFGGWICEVENREWG